MAPEIYIAYKMRWITLAVKVVLPVMQKYSWKQTPQFLPGVGSFGHAMECLQNANLVQPVLDFIHSGKPFLGICLGLQLLFEESEESPGVKGLGVFQGKIQLIPGGWDLKVPHIGWNSLDIKQNDGLFQNIEPEPYVYFVHSYYLKAQDREIVFCYHHIRN